MPTVSIRPPTVEVPSGSTIDTASPGLTRYSSETSKSTVTIGVVLVADSTVPPPPPTSTPSTATTADGLTDRSRDGSDSDRSGLEDDPAEEDLARRRQSESALPAFDSRRRRRRVVVALGEAAAEAERDQVVGELADVGTVGHPDVERPVGDDGAVEERHLLVVE